ncbi:MAG: 3-deoxy-8-phosphooctulonate synthase [Armatimonadota bacterium]
MNGFPVAGFTVGEGDLTVIAGPCLAESLELCLEVGAELQEQCKKRGFNYIFKASYDKANRTSSTSTRGAGMEAGLAILAKVKEKLDVPVVSDIHQPEQAEVAAKMLDMLQVPAFLCRQSDLLEACATTGLPVNVKKGQFLAPWDTKNIVEKLRSFDARGIMLTERGTSFGYNTLVVDMPGLETMRSFGVPVCFDATHSAQRPGGQGTTTGGARETIPAMSRAALAVGIDALFMEVHPDPANALSDASTQWPLASVSSLMDQIEAVWKAHQSIKSL